MIRVSSRHSDWNSRKHIIRKWQSEQAMFYLKKISLRIIETRTTLSFLWAKYVHLPPPIFPFLNLSVSQSYDFYTLSFLYQELGNVFCEEQESRYLSLQIYNPNSKYSTQICSTKSGTGQTQNTKSKCGSAWDFLSKWVSGM